MVSCKLRQTISNYTPKRKARQTVTCCELRESISNYTPILEARRTVVANPTQSETISNYTPVRKARQTELRTQRQSQTVSELHTCTRSQTSGGPLQATSDYVYLHTFRQSQKTVTCCKQSSYTTTRKARQTAVYCKLRQTISIYTPNAKRDNFAHPYAHPGKRNYAPKGTARQSLNYTHLHAQPDKR